ncbi:MAG: DUF3500 domain-containing protein [Bryobacteraceae bacterium]|jgi:hypothetical protein
MNLPSHHAHTYGDHAHLHEHGIPHSHRPSRRNFLGSLAMVCAALRLHAQSKPTADPQADRSLAEAANNFLATLRPELRSKYGFAFDDAYRKDWNNLPNFIHPRKGLKMGDLNPQERTAAHRLIQTMMSSQGYYKAEVIMGIVDEFLGSASESAHNQYGSEFYFLDVFGKPGGDDPWGVKLDGHHLAVNVAVIDHNISMTPLHLGADPSVIPSGRHAGWAVLTGETAKGFAMRNALMPEQAKRAVLSENVPVDIFTLPSRDRELQELQGLSNFQGHQRDLLEALIEEYLGNLRPDVARNYRAAIQAAGFDKVHFAWMGPSEPGKAVYYRVHGPTVLIEYDNVIPPNTKLPNDPNHIHTVLRSPGNDFGDDWLRRHHLEHHQI